MTRFPAKVGKRAQNYSRLQPVQSGANTNCITKACMLTGTCFGLVAKHMLDQTANVVTVSHPDHVGCKEDAGRVARRPAPGLGKQPC